MPDVPSTRSTRGSTGGKAETVADRQPSRRVLIERRLRRRSLPWVLRARELDRRPHADPHFIVAGAQKAGSTSLFAYLAAHPDVAQPLVKEINYFDLRADRGQRWYRSHFPTVEALGSRITGEASPMYMVHPLAMRRIAFDLPEVKVVTILREPVSRLISHYRHSVRLGHEPLSLGDALDAEESRIEPDLEALRSTPFRRTTNLLKFSYLTRSLYSTQVAQIQQLFPDRSVFLRLEDLTSTEALRPLCDFLGIRFAADVPFQAHNVNRATPDLDQGELPAQTLEQIRSDAEATCALLGWDSWAVPTSG